MSRSTLLPKDKEEGLKNLSQCLTESRHVITGKKTWNELFKLFRKSLSHRPDSNTWPSSIRAAGQIPKIRSLSEQSLEAGKTGWKKDRTYEEVSSYFQQGRTVFKDSSVGNIPPLQTNNTILRFALWCLCDFLPLASYDTDEKTSHRELTKKGQRGMKWSS